MSAAADDRPAALPRAVALRYDARRAAERDDVPRVVAQGRGRIAAAIEELARAHGVPVRSDPDLVALLATCETGAAIPTELYTAVAELLVWVYRANTLLGASEAEAEAEDGPARS